MDKGPDPEGGLVLRLPEEPENMSSERIRNTSLIRGVSPISITKKKNSYSESYDYNNIPSYGQEQLQREPLSIQNQNKLGPDTKLNNAYLPKSKLSLKEIRALAHSWGTPGHRFRFASLNSQPTPQDTENVVNGHHDRLQTLGESTSFNSSQASQSLEKYSDALTAQRHYVLKLEDELNGKDQALLMSSQREKEAAVRFEQLEQKLASEAAKIKEVTRTNSKLFHDLETSYCEREKMIQRIEDLEKKTRELTDAKAKAEYALRENITNLRKEIAAEQAAAHRIEIQRIKRELDARVAAEREAINATLKDSMEIGRVLTNDAHTLRTQQRTLVSQLEHSQGTVRLLHSRLKRFERLGSATKGARYLVLKLAAKFCVRNCTLSRLMKSILLQFAQAMSVIRSALPPSQGMQAQSKSLDFDETPLHKIALHTEFSQMGMSGSTSLDAQFGQVYQKPNGVYELPLEQILHIALGKDPLLRTHAIATEDISVNSNLSTTSEKESASLAKEEEISSEIDIKQANLDSVLRIIGNPTAYRPVHEGLVNKLATSGNTLPTPLASFGKVIGTTNFSLLPRLELWSQDDLGTKIDEWSNRLKCILRQLSQKKNNSVYEYDPKEQINCESEMGTKMEAITSAASLLVEGGQMFEVAVSWLIRRDAGHQCINRALAGRITELLNEMEEFRQGQISDINQNGKTIVGTGEPKKILSVTPVASSTNANLVKSRPPVKDVTKSTISVQASELASHSALTISQSIERNNDKQTKENKDRLLRSAKEDQKRRIENLNAIKRKATESSKRILCLQEAAGPRPPLQPVGNVHTEMPTISKPIALSPNNKALHYRITDNHHRNSPDELHLEALARMYATRLWRLHLRFPDAMGSPEENDILTHAIKSVNALQRDPSRESKDYPSIMLARAPRMRAKNISQTFTTFPSYFPCAASTELPPTMGATRIHSKTRPSTAHPKQNNEEHRYMLPKHIGNVRYSTTPFYKSSNGMQEEYDSLNGLSEGNREKDHVQRSSKNNLMSGSLSRSPHSNEVLEAQVPSRGNLETKPLDQLLGNELNQKRYDEERSIGKRIKVVTLGKAKFERSESVEGVSNDLHKLPTEGDTSQDNDSLGRQQGRITSMDDSFEAKSQGTDTLTHNRQDKTDPQDSIEQGFGNVDSSTLEENDVPGESKEEEELIAVVLQDYTPDADSIAKAAASSAPLLAVQRGQTLLLLDYDKDIHNIWVYAVNEVGERGFVPASYCKMYVASLMGD